MRFSILSVLCLAAGARSAVAVEEDGSIKSVTVSRDPRRQGMKREELDPC